jgi:hypothetical protein
VNDLVYIGGVSGGIDSQAAARFMLNRHGSARVWHRFFRMIERDIRPYPMVYDRNRTDLLSFQRWVLTGLYRIVKWDEYKRSTKSLESVSAYLRLAPITEQVPGVEAIA